MNGLPCQDAELKAEKYGGKPSKMLEKLGCEKYVRAKIMRVDTIYSTGKTAPTVNVLVKICYNSSSFYVHSSNI
jgi:hypothetical protein